MSPSINQDGLIIAIIAAGSKLIHSTAYNILTT